VREVSKPFKGKIEKGWDVLNPGAEQNVRFEAEGLRITLPGGGYLNFGALGFLVVGVVFGILCASLSDLSGTFLKNRDLPSSYLIATLFAWLCFWLYMGGTANAGTVQYELMFVFAMFFLARARRGQLSGTAVAAYVS